MCDHIAYRSERETIRSCFQNKQKINNGDIQETESIWHIQVQFGIPFFVVFGFPAHLWYFIEMYIQRKIDE